MNASTVLVLVERHKLEQDAATALQVLPKCMVVYIYSTNTLPALGVVTLGNLHW